jgi:hypothetical protein
MSKYWPKYWFPSIVAVVTAAVVIGCVLIPRQHNKKPWDNPAVQKIVEKLCYDRPELAASADNTGIDKLFDYELKEYQASLATLQTNLYLQAAFIIFGLLVLFGAPSSQEKNEQVKEQAGDEAFELPVLRVRLYRSWLYFIVPAILLFLWLRFGYLLDSLIKTRLYCWELFLRSTPTASKEYIRSGGALLEDSFFMDGWFALFRPNETLIDQTLVNFNQVIFPSVFGVLLAANHALILGLAYTGYARRPKKRERHAALLLLWFMFLILVLSHVLFYLGGPNPNWLQILVAGIAVVLLFLLTHFSRSQTGRTEHDLHRDEWL